MKEADYSKMSIDDLHALKMRAESEIETRRSADRDKIVQQIRALADEHGLTVTIAGAGAGGARRRGKGKKKDAETATRTVAVKYQHPQNKDLKWTGRGRKPAWINEWEGAKGSLDGLKVA